MKSVSNRTLANPGPDTLLSRCSAAAARNALMMGSLFLGSTPSLDQVTSYFLFSALSRLPFDLSGHKSWLILEYFHLLFPLRSNYGLSL